MPKKEHSEKSKKPIQKKPPSIKTTSLSGFCRDGMSKENQDEYDSSVYEGRKMLSDIAAKGSRKKVHTEAQEAYYAKKSEAIKHVMTEAKKASKSIMGRPTTYTEELADYIVDKVASSAVGLKQMCKDDDKMPDQSTVNLWRWKHPDFSARYQLAKQHQTYLMGEDCEEIAREIEYTSDQNGCSKVDPGFIASRRLIVDTKKWHTAKLHPTIFGDRKAVEALQNENESIKSELMALKAQLELVNKKEY